MKMDASLILVYSFGLMTYLIFNDGDALVIGFLSMIIAATTFAGRNK